MRKTIIILILTSLLMFSGCVPTMIHVAGISMEPTIQHDEWFALNSNVSTLNRGDIIVFESPREAERDRYIRYVQRLIAVAGDTIYIDFDNGNVYLNDEVIDEPFIMEPTRAQGAFITELIRHGEWSRENPLVIEDGYVFTMGDNRNNSTDSRMFGPVPVELIRGTISVR